MSTILLLLFAFPTAHAVENTVEFQLEADVLLALIQQRAYDISLGCPEPFDDGSEDWVVNHVVWGEPYLSAEAGSVSISFTEGSVSTSRPTLVLPVDAHFKSFACVTDPGCALDDTVPTTLPLEFVLSTDGAEICATYAGVDATLPDGAEAAIDGVMEEFDAMCAPLGLDSVTSLLGDDVTINDVAVAASASLGRIAVRIELDTPDGSPGSSLDDWETFLGGTLSPNFGGDFSIFVDEAMLGRSFGRRLTADMTCDPAEPESDGCTDILEPTSSVVSDWDPLVPEVQLEVDVGVDLAGLCTVGLEPVTIDAPFMLSADHGAIEIPASLDWSINAGDVALCALIPGMPPEALLILESIAQTYSASNELDGNLPSECLLVDDHSIDCEFPFTLPTFDLGPGPDAVLEATGLYGSATGLSLEGDVTFVGASVTPRQPLTLDGLTPTYMVGGSCSAITTGYEASLFVGGGTGLYCPDPYSGDDSPMVVEDPMDAYWVTEVGSGPADTADIGFPGANDASFWSYPAYGPQITVWSTVGSGTVQLETPEQFDWSIEWWVDNYLARWINCNAEETGLFGIPGLFDFHWLVDPPYGTLVSSDRNWNGSQATLRAASITQTGASSLDARTGIRTIPARSASLTTSWSVSGSRGSFSFETSVSLGVALQGAAMNEGWAMVLSDSLSTSISVPRASLPKGVRSASVSLSLDPTDLVLTGLVSR